MALPVLNSIWVGDQLGYVERLCIQSALHQGHEFRLYSYEPDRLGGVPDGVEVRDAAEVMPSDKLISYAECDNGVALGSNLWRYHLLAKDLGFWCDLDFVLIRAFDFDSEYVFGWEHEGWINNALMYAPAGSDFVQDLFRLSKPNVRPPWYGPRRSLTFYLRRWRRGYLGLEDMPWGTYSAGMLTHIVKQRGLTEHALGPDVLYPVRWGEAKIVYDDARVVEERITSETRAVHLWHSRLGALTKAPPPPTSWIGQQCRKYDLVLA